MTITWQSFKSYYIYSSWKRQEMKVLEKQKRRTPHTFQQSKQLSNIMKPSSSSLPEGKFSVWVVCERNSSHSVFHMACGPSAPCGTEPVLSKKADMKSSGWPRATAADLAPDFPSVQRCLNLSPLQSFWARWKIQEWVSLKFKRVQEVLL